MERNSNFVDWNFDRGFDKPYTKDLNKITYLVKKMKTINVTFDEEEYKKLLEKKKDLSWHDFILKLIEMKGGKTK